MNALVVEISGLKSRRRQGTRDDRSKLTEVLSHVLVNDQRVQRQEVVHKIRACLARN